MFIKDLYFSRSYTAKAGCCKALFQEKIEFMYTFFLIALQNYKLLFIFAQRKSKIIYILSDFYPLFVKKSWILQVELKKM